MKALAFLFAVPFGVAMSQPPNAVQVGARLKLVAVDTCDRATGQCKFLFPSGNLLSIDGQALVVRRPVTESPSADAVRVPVEGIIRAEEFLGRRRHPWAGALIGAGAGAVVGYISKAIWAGGQTCTWIGGSQFCNNDPPLGKDPRVIRARKYATIGLIAGGVGGFIIRTDRWRLIDLSQLRLQVGVR